MTRWPDDSIAHWRYRVLKTRRAVISYWTLLDLLFGHCLTFYRIETRSRGIVQVDREGKPKFRLIATLTPDCVRMILQERL
jgi:hypothetical protein